MRVAFLGPAPTAAVHALHEPAAGLEPVFIDVRAGADPASVRAQLERAAPDVVVALEAALLPQGALAGVDAATLAAGEPVDEFDRVLGPGGWRARPLPVDDRLYAPVQPARDPSRALFLGPSSEYRESVLVHAKHAYDVLHYAHGLTGEELARVLGQADIGIAMNQTADAGFPPQMLIHLAAGHLLLSEPPQPPCGLEAGIDFLAFDGRDALLSLLYQLKLRPDAYQRVRVRGRLKAEEHRASRVWPRLLNDLQEDLQAFGSRRGARIP